MDTDDTDDKGTGLMLENSENYIREQCERIATKMLPKVENALDILLEVSPLKGIIAWEKVAEFAISKKRERPEAAAPQLQSPNITINMIPAERQDKNKTIDISIDDAEIVNDDD
jgi:hypothetical protein